MLRKIIQLLRPYSLEIIYLYRNAGFGRPKCRRVEKFARAAASKAAENDDARSTAVNFRRFNVHTRRVDGGWGEGAERRLNSYNCNRGYDGKVELRSLQMHTRSGVVNFTNSTNESICIRALDGAARTVNFRCEVRGWGGLVIGNDRPSRRGTVPFW